MKLKRMLAIPFTLAADVVTLGNMGDRSYTQQLFDRERDEQELKSVTEFLRILAEVARK